MPRKPEDDSADAQNPNNDAYWASEANKKKQLAENED